MNNLELKDENGRYLRNIILFVSVYFLMGLVKGIDGDGLMSYIHLSMPTLSKGISIYIGISMLIMFFAILLVGKFGFKKMIVLINILFIISMIWLMFTTNHNLAKILLIFIELGGKGAEVIIAIVLMAYTKKDTRIKVFSYAIFFNVLGEALASYFDGKIVVYRFKSLLGITYDKANVLTENVKHFNHSTMLAYMDSYKMIIWIGAIIAAIIILLVLATNEVELDYKNSVNGKVQNFKEHINLSVFKNPYIIGWVIFSILVGLDSNIVTPHLPVYFNRILHISRGATSTIMSLKSVGMMVFVLIAPYIIKKLGKITSLTVFLFLAAPLMVLLGVGQIFGPYVFIAMAVFAFGRWGLTHATHPITESFPLTLVTKGGRPIFSGIITLINAIVAIIVGYWAKNYLYANQVGYHLAFFLIAITYVLAGILAFALYYKKFNRS
ncbi:MAG: MFS transporter [Sarcina sp.]